MYHADAESCTMLQVDADDGRVRRTHDPTVSNVACGGARETRRADGLVCGCVYVPPSMHEKIGACHGPTALYIRSRASSVPSRVCPPTQNAADGRGRTDDSRPPKPHTPSPTPTTARAGRKASRSDDRDRHVMIADTATPRDPITGLQLATSELCALYASALSGVQDEADKHWQQESAAPSASLDSTADDFVAKIVQAHREFEQLAAELERAHRPESEQLRVLAELQEQHAEVTRELRSETVAAEAIHASLHATLETLLDGIHSINAQHRVANLEEHTP